MAHQNHSHEKSIESDAMTNEKLAFEKINSLYLKAIKPIFKIKCMNCHSSNTNFPFYAKWPIIRNLIESDITEARKHINMDNNFPFGGHGTPMEDLDAIEEVTAEGTMPPIRYRILHWNSTLSTEEKRSIVNWINESKDIIKNETNERK